MVLRKIISLVFFLFTFAGAYAQSEGEFRVEPVEEVNSPDNDFAPFWRDSVLFFCSTKPLSWNLDPMPETVMFSKNLSGKDSLDPTPMDKTLQKSIHQGPLTFGPSGDTLYFTQTDVGAFQGKEKSSKLGIAMAVNESGKWKIEGEFEYNMEGYNTAHPSISNMGKYLYFSSNRPGGKGGMDIWRCTRDSGRWSEPENLGVEVNGPGNEVFPFAYKNRLYYSSDGGDPENDLDIFETRWEGKWTRPDRLPAPVNSDSDDLGITYVRSGLAYFSSNRPEGAGGDDIYRFTNQEALAQNFETLKGSLTYREEPAASVSVQLYGKNNQLLQQVETDSIGEFKLVDVDGGEEYSIKIVPDSGEVRQGYVLTLLNSRGEEVKKLAQSKDGSFKFELLSPDDFDNLQVLQNHDSSILDISLHGQVYDEELGDMGDGIIVYVMDDDKNVMTQTETKEKGKFDLDGLTAKDSYRLRVNIKYRSVRIAIFGEDGNVEQTLVQDNNGDFRYERLANEDFYVTMLNEEDVSINVKLDQNFKIPNIYYAYNEAEILPESEEAMTRLLNLLKKNPHIGVKIESHSDSRGSDSYNLELSDKRAKATVEYLVAKGISKDRLQWEGMGETQLLNKCSNGVDCPEEMHQENRRTEFSVLKKETSSEPTFSLEEGDHPHSN